ncbi:MAG: LysR family transcriptional regulator [Thiothrix sp.]|nr:MAG: LysR family transcriptional regulator [Thiothrix sp.]
MAFTLRQLQYFTVTASLGSMSQAAQQLSISQSAITEAIKELEADLGILLFERHARGLRLTHAGQKFLRHAQLISEQVTDARRAVREPHPDQVLEGEFNLGTSSLVSGYVLSDILARYRRAYPAVKVNAIEDSGDYLEHLLIGGELDAAVMVLSEVRPRMGLETEILQVSPYRLWLPLGHALLQAESVALTDLAQEPLIMLSLDEIEEATHRLLSEFNTRPTIAFRTRSVEAVRSLVATSAGVALLPDLVYRPWSLEGDRIESRDISGALPVIQVGVVWRKGTRLANHVRQFISIAHWQHQFRSRN